MMDYIGKKPFLIDAETYAMYAVVHNDERVKMGDAPRDILMHQIQQVQISPFRNVNNADLQSFDIRLSHSIVALYFGGRNTTIRNLSTGSGDEQSNYTTEPFGVGFDPVSKIQLLYEKQNWYCWWRTTRENVDHARETNRLSCHRC